MQCATSMRPFLNVAGYDGVFLSGPYPHWLMLTSRGELRAHPMGIDGPVPCFAPFHNVNCPQGFLYFNRSEWEYFKKSNRFAYVIDFANKDPKIV